VRRLATPADRRRPCVAAALCGVALLLSVPAARAQWSAGAGLDSQAVFRGVSMSDGQPSPHAALAWDGASGTYAGLSLARVVVDRGAASASWRGHLGYARRWAGSGLAWEAGVGASRFDAAHDLDYAEAYAGLIGDGWTLRLHAAPDYFGQSVRTVYAEADAGGPVSALLAWPAAWDAQLRWSAHLGALHRAASGAALERRWRADWRLGLAVDHRRLTLQLARIGAQLDPSAAHDGYGGPAADSAPAYGGASALRSLSGAWQASIDVYF
jgi:uncharacterized protein (TIGR02001 family)